MESLELLVILIDRFTGLMKTLEDYKLEIENLGCGLLRVLMVKLN